MFDPINLKHAIHLGKSQDLTLAAWSRKFKPFPRGFNYFSNPNPHTNPNPNPNSWRKHDNLAGVQSKSPGNTSKIPFNILTPTEMTARREK